MRVVIQRVKEAGVRVENECVARIGRGLLVFAGFGKHDRADDIEPLSRKIVNLRIFADARGKMNLNVRQAGAAILSVPQFTLCADTARGSRPGFDSAAPPETAREYWMEFNRRLEAENVIVRRGVFGANMEVMLINDGPVTIIMDSKNIPAPPAED